LSKQEWQMRKLVLWLLLLCAATPAIAADKESADLAREVANPVSSLISVPFQFNYGCCFGPEKAPQVLLNFQPVVPFKLTDDWNVIVRTIVPIIDQPEAVPGMGNRFGLGDTVQSFFFSPNPAPGGIIWAAGPVFLWPTGTESTFSNRKWGAGPTAVVLRQDSGWTYGVLANHIWSYAGEGGFARVSMTSVQPFLAHQWRDATTLTVTSESTYDWIGRQWTVPLDLLLSHVYKVGGQPLSLQIGPRYFPVAPSQSARWGFRFNVVFLFPS
jgi:hypothetical protein